MTIHSFTEVWLVYRTINRHKPQTRWKFLGKVTKEARPITNGVVLSAGIQFRMGKKNIPGISDNDMIYDGLPWHLVRLLMACLFGQPVRPGSCCTCGLGAWFPLQLRFRFQSKGDVLGSQVRTRAPLTHCLIIRCLSGQARAKKRNTVPGFAFPNSKISPTHCLDYHDVWDLDFVLKYAAAVGFSFPNSSDMSERRHGQKVWLDMDSFTSRIAFFITVEIGETKKAFFHPRATEVTCLFFCVIKRKSGHKVSDLNLEPSYTVEHQAW